MLDENTRALAICSRHRHICSCLRPQPRLRGPSRQSARATRSATLHSVIGPDRLALAVQPEIFKPPTAALSHSIMYSSSALRCLSRCRQRPALRPLAHHAFLSTSAPAASVVRFAKSRPPRRKQKQSAPVSPKLDVEELQSIYSQQARPLSEVLPGPS